MKNIRITRQFNFETAHALYNYDGKCKNIHGHSYKLFVTIIGQPDTDPASPKFGMVIDFKELKNIINENIIDKIDHKLVLSKTYPLLEQLAATNSIYLIDYQPTAENLLLHFVELLSNKLPHNCSLLCLRLYETGNSYAEWYTSDNP